MQLETLRLLPLGPRSVLIRVEAAQCCYSMTEEVLRTDQQDVPKIIGHGGVGVVEEVGIQVKRARVGDRVIVANTPQCGQCYSCLQGRSDMCEVKREVLVPIAERPDGTKVVGHNNYGGFGELMVSLEEYCIPTATKVPVEELAVLDCVGGAGLAATVTFVPVKAGTNVAVMGCGPIGLSAIQGARLMGAHQIIAVEPIEYRRQLASKLGATTVLDPIAEGEGLVEKVRDLCKGDMNTIFGGYRDWAPGRSRPYGPDHVVEAVGQEQFVPKSGASPDPTGHTALRQAYMMTGSVGNLVTTGMYSGNISLPAQAFANGGRRHFSGQLGGGGNTFRDMQRFVHLVESGRFDAKSIATSVFPLEQLKESFQAVADRTTVCSIIKV